MPRAATRRGRRRPKRIARASSWSGGIACGGASRSASERAARLREVAMGAEQSSSWTGMEVAVIGMACRFPGAEDVEEFWRNLCAGVESLSRFSAEELIRAGEPASLVELPGYVKVARTISGDDLFDAALFGFSPREAELVDPQQRLFLESSWQALEHAGYDSDRFPGPIGVFGGVKYSTYL